MTLRKSFFADTIEGALALAVRELGDEALVVDSRVSPPEYSSRGAYELVAAAPETNASRTESVGTRGHAPTGLSRELEQLQGTLTTLQTEIRRMSDCVARFSIRGYLSVRAELASASAKLLEHDVQPELVQAILEACESERRLAPHEQEPDEAGIAELLARLVARRVRTGSGLGDRRGPGKVVVLVGPAGAGKTTSISKLAAEYGPLSGGNLGLITLDTIRPAAIDQLRSCSEICDVPLEVADSSAALRQALWALRGRELVLIDTPGLSRDDTRVDNELAALMAEVPSNEVHLVLSAAVRTRDALESLQLFEKLKFTHLLFTHLDDTSTYGGILSAAIRSGRPLSFLSGGARPSARLFAPDIQELSRAILRGERVTTPAA